MDNDILVSQHIKEKQESTDFKERRFTQWNENYALYRDKVTVNRLTQRQAVNLPIARETLQTWISKIDEAPELSFEARGNENAHKDGEIVLNELWNYYFDKLRLDLIDNMEKKIVGLQGRGFKKWGWARNEIFCDLIDPYDVDIDMRANPLDLSTADYVIHKNIFRPLRTILANPKYDAKAKGELKVYLDSKQGLLSAAHTEEDWQMRQDRLQSLGAHNYDEYRAADVLVDINESYKLIWNEEEKRFVRHLIVIACDKVVLYNKPLKEAIGFETLPIVSWASDPDRNDMWSDGIVDSVRTVNKVINMYTSQDLENRSYRNFGMYFFNTMNGSFSPRAFEPKPFGMYGVPGNPQEVLQQIRIEPLADTNQTIQWLKDLIQSSVAQTATERGEISKQQATLGEIQLQFSQSQGRNEVVAKNYRKAWKESGHLFYNLLKHNTAGTITLYKKGANGKTYKKEVSNADWVNPEGYECKVVIRSEKEATANEDIQKVAAVQQMFPTNPVAQRIAKKKALEVIGWTSDEIKEVMEAEMQPQVQPTMDGQAPIGAQAPVEGQEGVASPLQLPAGVLQTNTMAR